MRSHLFATLLAIFTLPAALPAAVELQFTNDGLQIQAGSIGSYVLDYPALQDGKQKIVHAILQKNAKGKTATVTYEGGAQVDLAIAEGGKVTAQWSNVPADVESVELALQIPIGFNQGGKWELGEKKADFPVQKPASPHLFQGNAPALNLINYEGKKLEITVPKFSFLQLTDNREWNWSIFHFKAFVPFAANKDDFSFTISTLGDGIASKPLVDSFGQSTLSTWDDKLQKAEDLKTDVAAEDAWYASLQPPATDALGGLPDSKESLGLQATGFFHIENKDGKTILVNPLGNAFFHISPCGFNPNDDYTLTKGRESAYEWLPKPEGEFSTVFRKDSGGTILSFHLVNQIRKYGQPFDPNTFSTRMIERLRKWGFNSIGAFTALDFGATARKTAQFPAVAHLPIDPWNGIKRIPGIHETFDPFDEGTRVKIAANLAEFLPAHANDPLIIGWFTVNEPIYEQIPPIVPTLKGSEHACKRELVTWLTKKYSDIAAFNTAWGTTASSFDALQETPLALTTEAAKQDSIAFASHFLDVYHRLIAENVRKHDKNHLLLGSRLQPATISNEWICRAMGPHVDVMSFNYYTYGMDTAFLRRIHEWTGGKPMMLSEFFWSSPSDSGLTGGREVGSQEERGLAYRNYVEQAAALGFVVGIEWFTMVDQSVTGRWFSGFDGERANTGLMSVVDRPWKPLLKQMMLTNYNIYDVWFGKKPPFVWDDPRFKVAP